jgi:hypothetical protein
LYDINHALCLIRWANSDRPRQASAHIQAEKALSTEDLTLRWRKLAIMLPVIGSLVSRTADAGMYGDGGGLYLQVTATAKSWVFRFTLTGKACEMGLGAFSSVPLADARSRAAEFRSLQTASPAFTTKGATS